MLIIMLGSVTETKYYHNVAKELTYLIQGMVFDINLGYKDSAGYVHLGSPQDPLPWVKQDMYIPVADYFANHQAPTTVEMEAFCMVHGFHPSLVPYSKI